MPPSASTPAAGRQVLDSHGGPGPGCPEGWGPLLQRDAQDCERRSSPRRRPAARPAACALRRCPPVTHVSRFCPFPAASGVEAGVMPTKCVHAPSARVIRRARGWWFPPGPGEPRAVIEDSSCLSEAPSPVISLGIALPRGWDTRAKPQSGLRGPSPGQDVSPVCGRHGLAGSPRAGSPGVSWALLSHLARAGVPGRCRGRLSARGPVRTPHAWWGSQAEDASRTEP